jgi:hypothetical protein
LTATGKWSARVAIVASFTAFFLWTIRHDLLDCWRSWFLRDNLIPPNFEPIEIQPLTPIARKRITKSRRFLFLTGNKVVIPFRLSAEPSKQWLRYFKTSWRETNHAGDIRVRGRELRLKCEPQRLKESFSAIKAAIAKANEMMSKELEQLVLGRKVKPVTPEPAKNELDAYLKELDYT